MTRFDPFTMNKRVKPPLMYVWQSWPMENIELWLFFLVALMIDRPYMDSALASSNYQYTLGGSINTNMLSMCLRTVTLYSILGTCTSHGKHPWELVVQSLQLFLNYSHFIVHVSTVIWSSVCINYVELQSKCSTCNYSYSLIIGHFACVLPATHTICRTIIIMKHT